MTPNEFMDTAESIQADQEGASERTEEQVNDALERLAGIDAAFNRLTPCDPDEEFVDSIVRLLQTASERERHHVPASLLTQLAEELEERASANHRIAVEAERRTAWEDFHRADSRAAALGEAASLIRKAIPK